MTERTAEINTKSAIEKEISSISKIESVILIYRSAYFPMQKMGEKKNKSATLEQDLPLQDGNLPFKIQTMLAFNI